jgi:sialate O-acetylesterase
MLRRILFFAALSTMTLGMQAKVRLPHIIGDNMILQQDSKARLWGWDTPGKTIKVNVSWSKESYSAKTDSKGNMDCWREDSKSQLYASFYNI